MDKNKRRAFSVVLLLLVAIFWGLALSATQTAIDGGWEIFAIICGRCLPGGIICLLLSFKDKWWKDKKFMLISLINGVSTFAGYAFLFYGQKYSRSLSIASFITSLYVVVVPILAIIFTKNKFHFKNIIATIISILGVVFLSLNTDGGFDFDFGIGELLVFIGTLFFSVQILCTQILASYNKPFSVVAIQISIPGVIGLVGSLIGCKGFGGFKLVGLDGIIYTALIATLAAFLLETHAQKEVSPSTSSIILALEALFGAIFAIIIYKERITWQIVVGGILMIASMIIVNIDFRLSKNKKLQ